MASLCAESECCYGITFFTALPAFFAPDTSCFQPSSRLSLSCCPRSCALDRLLSDILAGIYGLLADVLALVHAFPANVLGGICRFFANCLAGVYGLLADVLAFVYDFPTNVFSGICRFFTAFSALCFWRPQLSLSPTVFAPSTVFSPTSSALLICASNSLGTATVFSPTSFALSSASPAMSSVLSATNPARRQSLACRFEHVLVSCSLSRSSPLVKSRARFSCRCDQSSQLLSKCVDYYGRLWFRSACPRPSTVVVISELSGAVCGCLG